MVARVHHERWNHPNTELTRASGVDFFGNTNENDTRITEGLEEFAEELGLLVGVGRVGE